MLQIPRECLLSLASRLFRSSGYCSGKFTPLSFSLLSKKQIFILLEPSIQLNSLRFYYVLKLFTTPACNFHSTNSSIKLWLFNEEVVGQSLAVSGIHLKLFISVENCFICLFEHKHQLWMDSLSIKHKTKSLIMVIFTWVMTLHNYIHL